MARSRRGSTFFAPVRKKTRWERFKEFLWNPETNQVLGRNAKGWFLIFIFYICLYTFLGSFFAVVMIGLNSTLDERMPKFILSDSPLGTTPGLTFRPRSGTSDIALISFKSSDESTWRPWVEQLNSEVRAYALQNNSKDCSFKKSDDDNTVCLFDVDTELGMHCTEENDYGYSSDEPCILLKINKMIGWKPETIKKNSDVITQYQSHRQDETEIDDNYVGVSCSSTKSIDKDKIGTAYYYPSEGFSYKYFPYVNQPGYLSPLVMVHFTDVEKNVVLGIECKIWAQNIEHDRQKRRGSIRFELKIEE